MAALTTVVVVLVVLVLLGPALSVRIVQQYERGVLFRLGRVIGVREPGLTRADLGPGRSGGQQAPPVVADLGVHEVADAGVAAGEDGAADRSGLVRVDMGVLLTCWR